ncbi:flavin reductase family protein [Streptomyces qaidamensis]|uniref:flavin reductase family protein n=1 Tax=Streptomyces qaidamensis TaxID=1783515 RepID=UPI00366684EC
MLRQAFGCFPSGVTALCARDSGGPVGMAASTFTPVSIRPPLVSVCVQDTSSTWPKLRMQSRLGLSVLAEEQDLVCRSLAGKGEDRFDDVDWEASEGGSVYIRGAGLWLDRSVYVEFPGGDHTIVLLEIHGLMAEPDREPLVFHGSRFRRLAVWPSDGRTADARAPPPVTRRHCWRIQSVALCVALPCGALPDELCRRGGGGPETAALLTEWMTAWVVSSGVAAMEGERLVPAEAVYG